jgi:hypothetical protein
MNHFSTGGSNPGSGEQVSQRSDHTFPNYLLGMRLVKNRLHTIQYDNDPRASRFRQLGSQCREQRFDVMPIDVGAHRIREDPLKDPELFLSQCSSWAKWGADPLVIVLSGDINVKGKSHSAWRHLSRVAETGDRLGIACDTPAGRRGWQAGQEPTPLRT